MSIFTLYTNDSDNNVVYKSLTNARPYDVIVKTPSNVITPIITITTNDNISQFNYGYMPDFGRYYYITSIKPIVNGVWEISLKVDVLMTYKNQMGNFEVIIERSASSFTPYLNDPEIKRLAYENVLFLKFPNEVLNKDMSIILTTVGRSE